MVRNIVLFRRNSSGAISWSKMWGGTDSERAYTISLDSLDNIYIGGWSQSYGSRSWVILKYTSEGSFQWSKFKTGHSECRDIFIDSSDGIYATGFSGSNDFTLVKYSPLGELTNYVIFHPFFKWNLIIQLRILDVIYKI